MIWRETIPHVFEVILKRKYKILESTRQATLATYCYQVGFRLGLILLKSRSSHRPKFSGQNNFDYGSIPNWWNVPNNNISCYYLHMHYMAVITHYSFYYYYYCDYRICVSLTLLYPITASWFILRLDILSEWIKLLQ